MTQRFDQLGNYLKELLPDSTFTVVRTKGNRFETFSSHRLLSSAEYTPEEFELLWSGRQITSHERLLAYHSKVPLPSQGRTARPTTLTTKKVFFPPLPAQARSILAHRLREQFQLGAWVCTDHLPLIKRLIGRTSAEDSWLCWVSLNQGDRPLGLFIECPLAEPERHLPAEDLIGQIRAKYISLIDEAQA